MDITQRSEDISEVAEALAIIPNDDASWWIGTTSQWRLSQQRAATASRRSMSGRKNPPILKKHTKDGKGLERSPPSGIGAGTLFHKAREISSSWRMATIDRLAAAANANADDFINDPLGGNAVSVKQMEQQVRHREASQLTAQIDHWLQSLPGNVALQDARHLKPKFRGAATEAVSSLRDQIKEVRKELSVIERAAATPEEQKLPQIPENQHVIDKSYQLRAIDPTNSNGRPHQCPSPRP